MISDNMEVTHPHMHEHVNMHAHASTHIPYLFMNGLYLVYQHLSRMCLDHLEPAVKVSHSLHQLCQSVLHRDVM